MISRSIAILAVTTLTGCLPLKLQDAPHLTGQVVSEHTKQPLQARVYFKDFPERAVSTTGDGRFELQPVSRWHFVIIGTDRKPLAILVAEAPGHLPAEKGIYFGGPDFTQVVLKPAP